MARRWPQHEAEDKLSEVVTEATGDSPQVIARQSVDDADIVAGDENDQLTIGSKKLSEFFRESPLVGANLDLTRDCDPLRNEPSP